MGEKSELFYIVFKSRENVHMIPGYAGEDSDIGVIMVEFGASVDGRRKIFVSFENSDFTSVAQVNHGIEAFQ